MASQDAVASPPADQSRLESLVSEFQGCVYRNVAGYDAKYFPRRVLAHANQPIALGSPPELLSWLHEFQTQQRGTAANKFILHDVKGGFSGTLDQSLCLVRDTGPKSETSRSDADVLLLGLFQTETTCHKDEAAMLRFFYVSMRVFAALPDRPFLHAFCISKSTMETWIFDRAGAYSGEAFDIVQEPDRFRNIIMAYMTMNDNGLGLNTALQQDDQGVFLELGGPRLSVEAEAFVKPDSLVGPGTTCFKARMPGSSDQTLVVKFSWEQGQMPAEQKLLAFANERRVWGLPQLQGCRYLGDIAALRQGLQFDQPFELSLPPLNTEDAGEPRQRADPESTPDTPSSKENAVSGVAKLETKSKFDNLNFLQAFSIAT
ncbi:hypothetical protein NLG97_g9857 [Lecanicillium saksenae]|uniref:Uncharacterized protein n=1 Tax=Lecanicillium saksenae TaxID=468837 RepID=A0ACC1QI38_9HYPO|nr:hypothetical protein NLG97_g9857 [Lecanicillium saksenae]